MTARPRSITFSLFGEIECLVAQQMMNEGKELHRLPLTEQLVGAIPRDVRFNKMGMPVRMVIVIPRKLLAEFESRIEKMRL